MRVGPAIAQDFVRRQCFSEEQAKGGCCPCCLCKCKPFLSHCYDVQELSALFSTFGEVESVRFRSVSFADTKLPRKAAFVTGAFHESRDTMNAYVVMGDADAARRGLSLNGVVFREKHLCVDLADGSEERDVSLSVFVGNLPFDTMEEELRAFFQCCGAIKSVRIGTGAQHAIPSSLMH